MPNLPYLISFKELKENFNIPRTTAYRWMVTRDFPKPKSMGPNSVKLVTSEVEAWIASLPDAPVHYKEQGSEL